MKTQPPDTTDDDDIYGLENTNNGELDPIPRSCALATAPGVQHYTQVLTMAKLKQVEASFGRSLSTPDTETQLRQDSGEPTHIAFGSKVKIPAHAKKSSSRDSAREGSGSRSSRSSHSRTQIDFTASSQQSELEASWNSVNARSRLNSESEPETPKPQLEVEAAQQCLQPRPPKTGSAGQTKRRPIRVRSGGKTRTQDNKAMTSDVTKSTDLTLQSVDPVERVDKNNSDQNNNIENNDLKLSVEDEKHKSESLKIENFPEGKQDLLSSDELSQYIQNLDISNTNKHSNIDDEISDTLDKNLIDASVDHDSIKPVFTFSSRPRSAPRSPKPRSNNEIDVNMSKEETSDLNNSDCLNSRGARYEDDFFKHSSESSSEDDEDIQRLLKSSMSPRGSPKESTPVPNRKSKVRKKKKKSNSNQLLNSSVTSVSIKSSLLREIPSPRIKEEEPYNAKNYQSDSSPWKNFPSTASSWMFDMSNATQSLLEHSNLVDKLEQDKNAINGHHNNLRSSLGSKEDTDSEIEDMDDGDNTLSLSSSDETTVSTWRPPPMNIRAHRYQDEMKPPGPQPDLTATLPMDARVYAGAFSPPIIYPSESNAGVFRDVRNGLSVVLSPPANGKIHSSSHNNVDSSLSHDSHEDELDLLYDPCLNCYFDPKTCKYYELS